MLLSTLMNNRTTLPLELDVDIFPSTRSGSDPDSGEAVGSEGIAMVLPAVVLLLSISSLLSELFRNRQRFPLLSLLALSDLVLSVLQIHQSFSYLPTETLARFPMEEQPRLIANFSLIASIHLFSIFSFLTCALTHLLNVISVPHHYQEVDRVFLVSESVKESEVRSNVVSLRILSWVLLPAASSLALVWKISSQIPECSVTENHTIVCLTEIVEGRLAGHGALAPVLIQILSSPLIFPLTLLTTIPLLILLAISQSLFSKDKLTRRTGWSLFLAAYSLFLVDLFLWRFPQPEMAPPLLQVEQVEPRIWRLEVGQGSLRREIASFFRIATAFYLAG